MIIIIKLSLETRASRTDPPQNRALKLKQSTKKVSLNGKKITICSSPERKDVHIVIFKVGGN